MKVKVRRWHGVAVWKWEIVDEDVSILIRDLRIAVCSSVEQLDWICLVSRRIHCSRLWPQMLPIFVESKLTIFTLHLILASPTAGVRYLPNAIRGLLSRGQISRWVSKQCLDDEQLVRVGSKKKKWFYNENQTTTAIFILAYLLHRVKGYFLTIMVLTIRCRLCLVCLSRHYVCNASTSSSCHTQNSPDSKYCTTLAHSVGDDCPPVWGQCGHSLHFQCVIKWLESQQNTRQECPLCRAVWQFRQ